MKFAAWDVLASIYRYGLSLASAGHIARLLWYELSAMAKLKGTAGQQKMTVEHWAASVLGPIYAVNAASRLTNRSLIVRKITHGDTPPGRLVTAGRKICGCMNYRTDSPMSRSGCVPEQAMFTKLTKRTTGRRFAPVHVLQLLPGYQEVCA
jgi:hypothetical protein